MNEKYQRAITLIDEANALDPNQEEFEGRAVAREWLYSERLTAWVRKLEPDASETLRLAARSQHICRWKIPRHQFPAGKAGYHQWKNALKRLHADATSQILERAGYDDTTIARVRALNLKQGFPADAETRILEDALCLVFLEFQLADLAAKAEPGQVINALQKSWAKMTEKARMAALALRFAPREQALLSKALAAGQGVA